MSLPEDALRIVAERLCGQSVASLTPVRRGGNNRIFRVEGRRGGRFALKCYPQPTDGRDRLGAEFGGLTFLANAGIEQVPKALAQDRAANIAVYEWIEGVPVDSPGDDDVAVLVDFAARLAEVSASEQAGALPLASEACLSLAELAGQVRSRLDRLMVVAEGADIDAFPAFLAQRLDSKLEEFTANAMHGYRRLGWDPQADLPQEARTLSPSDFGFHNAVRRPDGSLCFVDFEYFGWDDPVKLAADLLLHPGMTLSVGQKGTIASRLEGVFAADGGFGVRHRMLYPLYGLRWCMIILNEFLPDVWRRRAFAGAGDRRAAQERQLAKAAALLDALVTTRGRFIHDA